MVDCEIQTDFDQPQNNESLNIFFCSLYESNDVSTYCDLRPPNDQDTHIARESVSLGDRIDLIIKNSQSVLQKTEDNLPITTDNQENDKDKNTNKCSHCKRLIKKSMTLQEQPVVKKVVRKVNLDDLNEFLDFNEIEPPDEVTKSSFKCKSCCVNLEEPTELIKHVKENHRPTNIALMCNQCPVAFPLAFQLQAHKEAVHGRSYVINCGFCSKSFSETRIYIRHVMIKHAKNRTKLSIRCQVCSVKCKNMKVYRKHQQRHRRETEIDSNLKLMYTANGGDGLDLLNSVEQEHICDVCNFVFDSENALSVHKAHKHEPKEKHECKICVRTFRYRSELKYHMTRHGGPPYLKSKNKTLPHLRCHVCLSNRFRSQTGLEQHLLGVHKVKTDAMKILSCNICGKEFVCKSRLKTHQDVHSGKRHVCNICDKKFNSYSGLLKHRIMVHFPDKAKHHCTICSKSFMNKCNLDEHMSIHTGVKRYTCTECGAKFRNKGNLTAHIKSIHGVAVESVAVDGSVETMFVKVKRGPRVQNRTKSTQDEVALSDTSETHMEVDEIPASQNYINFQYF